MNWKDIKNLIKEELKENTEISAGGSKFNLRTGVNKNPTKLGVKIQFEPKAGFLDPDTKAKLEVALQEKLNNGLSKYKIQVSKDTDVPREEVIGFFIPLSQLKALIIEGLGQGDALAPGAPLAPEPEGETSPDDDFESPEEDELKTLEQAFRKYAKQSQIDYYSKKFKEGGTAGLTEEMINKLTGPNLQAVIKGWNENNPEDSEFFVPRYGTTKDRKSGRASGGRLPAKEVLVKRLIDAMGTSGLDIPSKSETQEIDEDFQVIVDELERQKGDIAKLKQKIKKNKES